METAASYLPDGARCEYLLRIVEHVHIAIRRCQGSTQLLKPRPDLFRYQGSFAWGYSGTGVKSLAYALVADACEAQALSLDIDQHAHALVLNLLSGLSDEREYRFTDLQILRAAQEKPASTQPPRTTLTPVPSHVGGGASDFSKNLLR